ncbi:branched-chain amino acid aminotransferase [Propionibacteriaceae bacterium Y1923]|uniref:branched-chain amino acid aminotransferase n=1 Tax=Aestuariimicrobium sp. Y1814 TaxID=3418742 RepID=UPI003C1C2AD7
MAHSPAGAFPVTTNSSAVTEAQLCEIMTNPGFGAHFTDHMVLIDWEEGRGWHDHRIVPTGPLPMHPSSAVLHYAQEIFEGLKAYRHDDDSVWLFRPEMNAARMSRSAERMSMPALPEATFLNAVRQLVDLDRRWVPGNKHEENLYIRPFTFATERLIGVRPAKSYTFCVLMTPAGAYYNEPMKLWLTPNYSRVAPGGTGKAKTGGSYAASLIAADEAAEQGCGQVLWLDGAEHRWLEECGTMNIMFVTSDGELLTPKSPSILDGVTRDSILQLAGDHGLTAVERPIEVDELRTRLGDQTITEAFACGTAAVVTPITGFKAPDWEADVADGQVGPKTQAIRATLLDIQYGRTPDTRGWTQRV